MFSKLFRKKSPLAKPDPQPAVAAPAVQALAAAKANAKAVWVARLQSCRGDDAALLALAREAPLVEIKQSAVAALGTEDALKLAEREFRTQNQGVHRLAKQRYASLVLQRESRARAATLIAAAAALVNEATVPANRLVELDLAWQALDAGALGDELNAEYARLAAQLTAQLRQRGEQQLALSRWSAHTRETLQQLRAGCTTLAAGGAGETELAAAVEAVQLALASKPAGVALAAGAEIARLEDDCQSAIRLAAAVVLEQAAQQEARAAAEEAARQRTAAKPVAPPAARVVALQELPGRVKAAEDALGAGHVGEARQHLLAIDQVLDQGAGKPALSPALRTRIEAVKAEFARLKDWQLWGGGRVREDLVEAAESLARIVVQLDERADERSATKFKLKPHAEAIEQLRQRWKDLDRLGGAGGKALWPRFDAALKAAYAPVAAQQEKLKLARSENLAARQRLIEQLDSLRVGAGEDGGAVTDWREVARALEHFESEWRKLGPVEHTVPHKARDSLLERRAASVARIESPLQEARRGAQAERQKFIERAKALAGGGRARDGVARVRDLQGEWQQHAKALPLTREVENALWAEFKAATDQVFKQREAEFAARTAEFEAHQSKREGLVGRLEGLPAGLPAAEIEQAVAGVDREWQHAGEVPSGVAGPLEQRFRAARATALAQVAAARGRAWQSLCDAVLAKLALCETAEAAGGASAAELESRWPHQPDLPPAWESALAARFGAALAPSGSRDGAADRAAGEPLSDGALLRLEAALDLPSPPAFQAARRELKLLAMKEALEGRQGVRAAADDLPTLLADVFRRQPTPAQRDRLQTILAGLRESPRLL